MHNLKFKIYPVLILLFTFYILHSVPAFAQTASDSADQLRNSVKQKVSEELAQIKQDISKKAFVGSISSKTEATVNLVNYAGQNRSALVTTDTAIKLKDNSDGTPADLKTGDYILVMGDVDGSGNMTAKRLLVIASPPAEKRQAVWGMVTSIGNTIKLTTSTGDNFTGRLFSDTTVTTTKNGKPATLKSTDVKIGSLVVIIAKPAAVPSITDLYIYPTPPATPTP